MLKNLHQVRLSEIHLFHDMYSANNMSGLAGTFQHQYQTMQVSSECLQVNDNIPYTQKSKWKNNLWLQLLSLEPPINIGTHENLQPLIF